MGDPDQARRPMRHAGDARRADHLGDPGRGHRHAGLAGPDRQPLTGVGGRHLRFPRLAAARWPEARSPRSPPPVFRALRLLPRGRGGLGRGAAGLLGGRRDLADPGQHLGAGREDVSRALGDVVRAGFRVTVSAATWTSRSSMARFLSSSATAWTGDLVDLAPHLGDLADDGATRSLTVSALCEASRARVRMSPDTTAKPRPASPARAASTAPLVASMVVWTATRPSAVDDLADRAGQGFQVVDRLQHGAVFSSTAATPVARRPSLRGWRQAGPASSPRARRWRGVVAGQRADFSISPWPRWPAGSPPPGSARPG
jgi:hypothetical protein